MANLEQCLRYYATYFVAPSVNNALLFVIVVRTIWVPLICDVVVYDF